jgi:N-acetylglucosamine malate deacetylase 1
MNKNILVVAPHPDDETVGCGGTLLKHKADGDQICWMIVTNMDTDHGWPQAQVDLRQQEIDSVTEMYGFDQTFKLDFPAAALETIPFGKLIPTMAGVINNIQPDTIYLPNRSDAHTDHHIVFKAVYSCTKNFRYPFVNRVLMYETMSETEFAPALPENVFIPNVFVDVTDHFEKKIEIFRVFDSEVMDAPLPRSIDAVTALAQYRGSRISKKYAEAFSLCFDIQV